MPAQPRTMASARSSSMARRILAGDLGAALGVAFFEVEDGDVGGADAGAAMGEAVADEVVLDGRDRAGEGGDDGELVGEDGGEVEAGLADADDRGGGEAAHGVEAGVVEAGDHHAVDALGVADHVEEAGDRDRLVEVALDADRAGTSG